MRIDNNQVIDSYGADTLQPTNERQFGVIPQRRHEVNPFIVSPSGASGSVRLFHFPSSITSKTSPD
jgi:hypothetical protein